MADAGASAVAAKLSSSALLNYLRPYVVVVVTIYSLPASPPHSLSCATRSAEGRWRWWLACRRPVGGVNTRGSLVARELSSSPLFNYSTLYVVVVVVDLVVILCHCILVTRITPESALLRNPIISCQLGGKERGRRPECAIC